MHTNHVIRCYFTKEEFDKVIKDKKIHGFNSASAYMRVLALSNVFRRSTQEMELLENLHK